MTLRRLAARLSEPLRRRSIESQLDDELRAHLELAEREAVASGMSRSEARRVARLRLGGMEQVRDDCRDERGLPLVETFVRDLRYGFSRLARDPLFTAIAAGVLALGIGANAAIFSLIDAVFLKPLPFPEPDRIVRLWEAPQPGGRNSVSTLYFLDWKRRSAIFEALSVERGVRAGIVLDGEPARLSGRLVSADYFDVFGISASRGRTFLRGEDSSAAQPVVVLTQSCWQGRFGGAAETLGSDVELDGVRHTIVGILPFGSFDREGVDFFKPLVFAPAQMTRDYHWLQVYGRLKPGLGLGQARSEMAVIAQQLAEIAPSFKQEWGVTIEPFDARLVNDTVRTSLFVIFGVVAMVLLIACVNVTNLLLAKGAGRGKEMAVRSALGAGASRLISQLLTENLALTAIGGFLGFGLAYLLLNAMRPLLGRLPATAEIAMDYRVLAFTAVVLVATSILTGLVPSLVTPQGRLSETMNRGARGSTGSARRLRRVLVAGEVAASLVLVCGALLLMRSLLQLHLVDAGVRTRNLLTMSIDLPANAYPSALSARRFYRDVVGRIDAIPGVERSAISTDLPLQGVRQGTSFAIEGHRNELGTAYKRVSPDYFAVFEIPLIRGRGLGREDRDGSPYAMVVNEAFASRLAANFGIDDPVGRMVSGKAFHYAAKSSDFVSWQIVGVIADEKVADLRREVQPVAYVPLEQVPRAEIKLSVASQGEAGAVTAAVREAIRRLDPSLPVGDIRTMEQIRELKYSGVKEPAVAVGVSAAVAGLLAALGLYGVLAHAIAQRRKEIGIRMALGAGAGAIQKQVLGEAAAMAAYGIVAGLFATVALTRLMQGLLFQTSPLDPVALVGACLATLAVCAAAGWAPASRAASVEPLTVLRDEG